MEQQFSVPLRSSLTALLSRGIAAGQIRPSLSPDAVAELLIGGMMLAVLTGRQSPPTEAGDIADLVLNGLRPQQ